jgi:hypothetical protein
LFCRWCSYEDSDDDGLSDVSEDDEVLAQCTYQGDLSASVALLTSAALPASAGPEALLFSAATLASAVLMVTPRLVVAGRSLCADFASLAGTPATLGAATLGAASPSWWLEVLEKELLGAATAGGMVPRLADLEVAWLQVASAGAVRVRFTAFESELGMPSSASDAALAPQTPTPLAPPSAIVSPNGVSLFPASPADAFLGLAAGSSPKSPGAPTPGYPSSSARGDFPTLSDYIGNISCSTIAASENPPVPPKLETHKALPPALSGSPGNPSPSALGDFSTLSDCIGKYLISWSLPPRSLPFCPNPKRTRPYPLLSAAALVTLCLRCAATSPH